MKEAKIIVLAGQSNAVGVGHTKCLPKHFSAERIRTFYEGYEHVLINYYSHDKRSGGFVPTTVGCTELTKDTLGPEVGMAERLCERYPGQEVFIVKCAFGGSNLHRDWLSPSGGAAYDCEAYADQTADIIRAMGGGEPLRAGWCYNELVRLLRESMTLLSERGYTPTVRAFCWMQGESDADTAEHAAAYPTVYGHLLADLRAVFGASLNHCTYIDGGISALWPFHREINAAKARHAATHENSYFIDTIAHGLTTVNEPEEELDVYHYDSDCVIRLGRLFAELIHL